MTASTGAAGDTASPGAGGNVASPGAAGNAAPPGAAWNAAPPGAAGDTVSPTAAGNAASSGAAGNAAPSGAAGNAGSSGAVGNAASPRAVGNAASSGVAANAASPEAAGNIAPPRAAGNTASPGVAGNPAPPSAAGNPAPPRKPRLRAHLGTLAGTAVLAVLLWRLGTGVFLDGLRRIDGPALLGAVGIGTVTTACCARRWQLVARGLGIRLPYGPAVADYYRALFLNAALPGGVVGDVHRAVRHGRSAGDLGRGLRAVVLERTAGQAVLVVAGAVVLLIVPSPVRTQARQLLLPAAIALLGALAVVLALRMNRGTQAPGRGRALAREFREALLSRRNGPGVALWSLVALAGHLALFLLAARTTGTDASPAVLLPLAVLALLAMSLPLNVGGWGPREGVTAWAFGAAGLGAGDGLAVAVVYGVLGLAASLPGAVVLVARRRGSRRRSGTTGGALPAVPEHPPAVDRYPRSSAVRCRPIPALSASSVSSVKYAAKESTRLASSSFPFSAVPSEGRPMTPESV